MAVNPTAYILSVSKLESMSQVWIRKVLEYYSNCISNMLSHLWSPACTHLRSPAVVTPVTSMMLLTDHTLFITTLPLGQAIVQSCR